MKFERFLELFVAFVTVLTVLFLDAWASLPFIVLLLIAVAAGVIATTLGHRVFRRKKA